MVLVLFALLVMLFLVVFGMSAVLFAVRNGKNLWLLFAVLFGICVGGVTDSFMLGIVAMLVSGYFLRGTSQSAGQNPPPNGQQTHRRQRTWTAPPGYGHAPYPQATAPQKQIVQLPLRIQGIEELRQQLKEMEIN